MGLIPTPNMTTSSRHQTWQPKMSARLLYGGVLKEAIVSCPTVGQTLGVPRRFCFQHCAPIGGTLRVEISLHVKMAIFRASFQVLTPWCHLRWLHTFFLTSNCSCRQVKASHKARVSMCQPCADTLWHFTQYLCVGTVVNSPGLLT